MSYLFASTHMHINILPVATSKREKIIEFELSLKCRDVENLLVSTYDLSPKEKRTAMRNKIHEIVY